jgi:hypothetical protein
MKARAEREERYVKAVLFAGLRPAYRSDFEGDEVEQSWQAEFTPGEFSELLRRCAARGVALGCMVYRSDDGRHDKSEFRKVEDPVGLFMKWQKAGCREHFSTTFRIPDAEMEAFDPGGTTS